MIKEKKSTYEKIKNNIQRPFTNSIYKDIRTLGADSAFNGLQIGSMVGTGLGLLGGLGEFTGDLLNGEFNPSSMVADPIIMGSLGALTGSGLGALYGGLIRKTGNKNYDKQLEAKRKIIASRLGQAIKYSTLTPTKAGLNYIYSGSKNLSARVKNHFQKIKEK